jgi:acyl-CoA synthetase (AMP-forming)/AMP-acid ligase II
MDVRTLMRRSAEHHRDLLCTAEGDREFTFAEQWDRGLRLANWLLGLGLEPGDRVAVLEDNTIESADFFCAAAAAGLVRVPLYARNAIDAHRHMMDHTGCRAVVVSANHADDLEGMTDAVASLEHVLVRDDDYETNLARQSGTDPDVPISEDDWYIIRHTGGTTGPSKGVGYTHRSWINAGRDWVYLLPALDPGDAYMHFGPISHASGYLFLPSWMVGAANIVVPKFDPATVLDLLIEKKVAMTFLAPTMLNMVVQRPDSRGRSFPDLKCVMTGASPITDDTARGAREVFGDVLWQLYGQTEAVPASLMSSKVWFNDYPGSNPMRATGKVLPWVEVEIWDPDTHAKLDYGDEGEIVIRCDGQMSGFWDDPKSTRERLVDGWVLTGDIGMVDANGFLYLLDRKDDMIISGGFNIWPAELENALMEHPQVVEAAAFGVPDDKWGEVPYARVRVSDLQAVTEEELIALCATALGSYKKPKHVELTTEELPKSPVGKLQRKLMREPFWAGRDRRIAGA